MLRPTFRALLWMLALSPAWGQTTVYVDPSFGDDRSSGATELEAFQSITHALAVTSGQVEVRVLPGAANLSTGEVFPLVVETGTTVIGVGGAQATFIEVPSVPAGLSVAGAVEGTTLVLSGTGVGVNLAGSLARVRIEGGDTGVEVLDPSTLDHCTLSGQTLQGVDATSADVTLRDCTVEDSKFGIYAGGTFSFIRPVAVLERCTIRNHSFGGVVFEIMDFNGYQGIFVRDSLIVGNGSGITSSGYAGTEIEGSTIADNDQFGLLAGSGPGTSMCRNSIFAGNGRGDIDDGSFIGTLAHCLIQDGSGPSGPGKIVADPLFVNAASMDYSLQFSSPCIDIADPSGTPQDLLGLPRGADGDLDLIPAPDIGAYEHQNLQGPQAVELGVDFTIGVTGATGQFSTIFLSLAGFAAQGQQTPFGRFFLPTAGLVRIDTVMTTGAAPSVVAVDAVIDPALVGSVIAFQAATRSTLAPAGAAFSNPLGVTILE